MEAGARARSAAVWLALAAIVVVVVGVVYLRPGPTSPSRQPVVALPSRSVQLPGAPVGPIVSSISFQDANRGSVDIGELGGPAATFVTSDGGRTWRHGGALLYAGTRLVVATASGRTGPRISWDAGRTWRPLAEPQPGALTGPPPTFLDATHGWWAVEPASQGPGGPRTVSLWRTGDGGATWRRLEAAGLPPESQIAGIQFADGSHGALAATLFSGSSSVLVTDDGGESWRTTLTPVSPFPDMRAVFATILPVDGRLLAWTVAITGAQADGRILILDPAMSTDSQPFVYASDDWGRTWSAARPGPDVVQPFIANVVPDLQGDLLVMDGRRLWSSRDAGVTWMARLIQVPSGLVPVNVLPTRGALFAAASTGGFAPTALLRSTDGGARWERVPLP